MLWIVIVHFGDSQVTASCLESIAANDTSAVRIALVDNDPANRFDAALPANICDHTTILTAVENHGFAAGANCGVRYALHREAESVLLLNHDVIVSPDFVTSLRHGAKLHHEAGIFGCKIYQAGDQPTLWYAGGALDRWQARTQHFGMNRRDGPEFSRPLTVSFVTGCAMLVRVRVFEQIGLLDESLFLYFEDADFCQRASRAGIKVLYWPEAEIHHEVGALSSEAAYARYLYYQTRNRYIVLKRDAGWLYRMWLWLLHALVFTGVRIALLGFVRGILYNRVTLMRAVWRGFVDSLRGLTGERR